MKYKLTLNNIYQHIIMFPRKILILSSNKQFTNTLLINDKREPRIILINDKERK